MSVLHVAREADTLVWTIDRPHAKNALDHATLEALAGAVESASNDAEARAAVLTARGDVFVAGGDLRELRTMGTAEDGARFSELGYALFRAIEQLPFPVICAMPGPAIGGGAELALACDLRVADPTATLSFKQTRMGVTTAWGTTARLVQLAGTGAAARLLYGGRDVSAEEGRALGLVDEISAPGEVLASALAYAADVARGSPRAVAETKRLVRAAATAAADEVRALELELFASTWAGADHHEAVEAYFEKRPPRWSPR